MLFFNLGGVKQFFESGLQGPEGYNSSINDGSKEVFYKVEVGISSKITEGNEYPNSQHVKTLNDNQTNKSL